MLYVLLFLVAFAIFIVFAFLAVIWSCKGGDY